MNAVRTVGDLRKALKGLPQDEPVSVVQLVNMPSASFGYRLLGELIAVSDWEKKPALVCRPPEGLVLCPACAGAGDMRIATFRDSCGLCGGDGRVTAEKAAGWVANRQGHVQR
jgi:hypothetical protein